MQSLVLVGLPARPNYVEFLFGASTALVAFVAAVFCAGRATRLPTEEATGRTAAAWPNLVLPRVVRVLAFVTVAQIVIAVGVWLGERTEPIGNLRLAVLALSGGCMGAQTALARRLLSRSGVTTTFVTGTLTSLMLDAADGNRNFVLSRILMIGALPAGALAGGAAMSVDGRWGAAVAAIAACGAFACVKLSVLRQSSY